MKKFGLKILLFLFILIAVFSIGIILPPTPLISKTLLLAEPRKDSLLKNVKSPRIIFIGGSVISFGLNSKMIKDSLHLNPINTGIHGGIGLIYMLDNTLSYIKAGDTVVVVPEYQQFYGTLAYGDKELAWTILDVNHSYLWKLRKKQWLNFIKYVPKYCLSKFDFTEYFTNDDTNYVYGVHSFNEYGDAYRHWKMGREEFAPDPMISDQFNSSVINELSNFQQKLIEKGAVLFISFPAYQDISFENNRKQIMCVDKELIKKGFTILGDPEKYKIPDSMVFNTPYHLLKKGADYRTNLLINDFRRARIGVSPKKS